MTWYIVSPDLGYFIGHFLGLGFFTRDIKDGTCDPCERPVEFESQEEAQNYLVSWVGGTAGCFITNKPPSKV